MSSLPESYLTPEEYLEIERRSETKSEYYDGWIRAMAGASEAHQTILFNLSSVIRPQLRGVNYRGYAGDLRVKILESGAYVYPDLTVVCGERRFDDRQKDALLNPNLIVEVLSPSAELFDRGIKFSHYRRLESLTDYLLIAQDRPCIERYSRRADQEWRWNVAERLEDAILIPSLGLTLPLSAIYEEVEFPKSPI